MSDRTNPTNDQSDLTKPDFGNYKETFAAYESGKRRRYDLLFAVNGGVLAIAQISPEGWRFAILGILMIAFTLVMMSDIRAFGMKFRDLPSDLFGPKGEKVLYSLSGILCVAWLCLTVGALLWSGVAPTAPAPK